MRHPEHIEFGGGDIQPEQANQGYPYRIRADYVRDTKDHTNTNADSAWQYFMVEP